VIRSQGSATEITFSHIWGTPPGEQAAETKHPMEQVIDAFNAKNTGVKVLGQTPSGDYYEVLQKAQAELAAGKPPALVITPWSNIYFATEGLSVDNLEDVAAAAGESTDAVLKNIKANVINLVQIDGKTKGLPWAFSCPVVYYNADLFTKAGVDPAATFKTWDSYAQAGPKLQSAVGGNPVIAFGTNLDWPAQSLAQSNGGRILDDGGKPVMDSPETVAAMQMVADLDKQKLYFRGTSKESRAAFVGGSIPCWVGSIASLGGLTKNVKFGLKTSPFPTFGEKPRKMSSGGSFIGVYARDKDQQKAAWEFLKFAISQEGYSIWMKTGYLNISNYDLPILPGQEAAYTQLDEGLTAESAWPGPRGGEIQATWGNYVARIWASDIGAEEGCKDAVKDIKPLLP
jgi:multiple sugar transport system substrate-binding protein